MTRAMSRLLHGDLSGAWGYNKIIFIVFIVMTVILIVNLVKSVKYYKKTKKIFE